MNFRYTDYYHPDNIKDPFYFHVIMSKKASYKLSYKSIY